MSSEKGAEVVGCDASIMKNVWEIRVREYGTKLQLEQERVEKSALPTINKDWEGRLAARNGGYKRAERKTKRQAEPQTDENVWKTKPQPPRVAPPRTTAPRGGSAPPGRPGVPSKGFTAPTPAYKDKKVQDKSVTKMQLLMYITQTQPSMMVWGKAWKYNKSLPPTAEGSTAGPAWGQCWMFATQQPPSEEGKQWSGEPNTMDPHSLHFWRKQDNRMMESQQLDLSPPAEEWQVSWQRADKMRKDEHGEGGPKAGYFTRLMETQRHNESLYSSEWSDSWQSTKPADQQDHHAGSHEGVMSNQQGNEEEINSEWEECWKLTNHHGSNTFKPRALKALGPQWAQSWRAATVGFSNHSNAEHSQGSDQQGHQGGSHFNNILNIPRSHNYRNMHQHFYKEIEAPNEWNKSWQVAKNNSKPSEEIEKVLKAPLPKMDSASGAHSADKGQKEDVSMPPDPRYAQLKHDVIHHIKREFPQSKLRLMQQLQKMLPSSDWKDSWKMIKHRMRMERRRTRPDPKKPFGESEKGDKGDKKPTPSEWKDSWKYTCKPLNQVPERWQEGWFTTNQIRVNWERHQSEFAPVEFPKNGPTGEKIWGESWKFSRRQHRSEPGQSKEQTSQGKSNVPSHHHHHHHHDSWEAKRTRSISDWQQAWMVSETQFRHDKPSLSQWREAWKWSIYHTLPWTEHTPRDKWVDEAAEIQHRRRVISMERATAKLSRSFDHKMFRERYPEKEWSSSWNAESTLQHQPSYYGATGQGASSRPQQQKHPLVSEHGSVWGRSFRFANPMPKLNQPWVKSQPNSAYYTVMWSRGKKTHHTKSNLSSSTANLKLWATCCRFLQGPNGQAKGQRKSTVSSDPREIFAKMVRARKSLYSNMEKERDKQLEKRWAGCHLWGKAQPRPKKGRGSGKKLAPDDKDKDRFLEEWMESWKFLVRPGSQRKHMSFKSLSSWDESWKFLFPPYMPILEQKGK